MLAPNQIPSTGRKTVFQVKQLGFASLSEFADSLPQEAIVTDIGAGLSRLGNKIASIRPDIRWINIDPCYANKAIFAEVKKEAPTSVEFLTEDIVQGSPGLTKLFGRVDLVYSYWMLPHLSLENDVAAKAALENMYELLKPEGKLIVGPVKKLGFGFLSPYRYKGTVEHPKAESKSQVIDDVLTHTRLWWLPRMVQLVSNRYNIHFGTLLVGGKRKE